MYKLLHLCNADWQENGIRKPLTEASWSRFCCFGVTVQTGLNCYVLVQSANPGYVMGNTL